MKLPMGFGDLDLTDWMRGLISAFVSGGATSVSTSLVGSALTKDLAIGTGKFFVLVGTTFVVSGTLSMMNFLRTKPIPDLKTVTTTVSTISNYGIGKSAIVATVSETHTEAETEKGGGPTK